MLDVEVHIFFYSEVVRYLLANRIVSTLDQGGYFDILLNGMMKYFGILMYLMLLGVLFV